MALNSRTKGKVGETEWINRFQPFFPNELKRNLEQVRSGGADIAGCEPFLMEIKRCEKVECNKWWRQINAAVSDEDQIPCVAYRVNRGDWMFQIPTFMMGVNDGQYMIIKEDTFVQILLREYKK